jgi:hypothetical protein
LLTVVLRHWLAPHRDATRAGAVLQRRTYSSHAHGAAAQDVPDLRQARRDSLPAVLLAPLRRRRPQPLVFRVYAVPVTEDEEEDERHENGGDAPN